MFAGLFIICDSCSLEDRQPDRNQEDTGVSLQRSATGELPMTLL